MRRLLSSFLIALAYGLVLVPEAVHLPALAGHYLEHRAEDPDLELLDFLALHYGDKEHERNGDAPHEQLPFHHPHSAGENLPTMALLTAMPLLDTPQLPVPAHAVHGDDAPLAGHRHGLIQPPRC